MALRPRALLAGAGACAVAFVTVLLVAYGWPAARAVDAAALDGFLGLRRPKVDRVAALVVDVGDPGPVLLGAAVLAGIALLRTRPRVALFVLVLVAVTSVLGQLLKVLLAHPRAGGKTDGAMISDVAFPSGHTTATMSLAIALLVVAPAQLRALTGLLGGGAVLAMSYSLVASGSHFPSDVLGGYLLAAGTALALLAGLEEAEARFPRHSVRALDRPAQRTAERLAAFGLAGVLLVAALALAVGLAGILTFRLSDLVGYAQAHTAFFAVAAVLAVTALTLISALVVAVGRRE